MREYSVFPSRAVKMSPPSLSVCSECASPNAANTFVSDALAECIQCGRRFLLPQTSSLAEESTLSGMTDGEPLETPALHRNAVVRFMVSILVSLIVNGGLLTVLGLLYFHVAGYQGYLLNGTIQGSPQNDMSIFPIVELGGAEAEQGRSQPALEIARVIPTRVGELPASDGLFPRGVAALAGDRGTGSGGAGTGLFGGVRQGESFAYVVDASGSMSGDRMKLVLEELRTSVNSLAEHHRFFVVFFNKHTYAMMWPKIEKQLVTASQRNKDRVLGWAFGVQPQEVTEPQRALRMALDLKPDIVFFLTDGDIPEESLRLVRKYRRDRTSVHTICVGEDAAIPVMQKIAEVGQGAFLMVQ